MSKKMIDAEMIWKAVREDDGRSDGKCEPSKGERIVAAEKIGDVTIAWIEHIIEAGEKTPFADFDHIYWIEKDYVKVYAGFESDRQSVKHQECAAEYDKAALEAYRLFNEENIYGF